MMWRLVRMVLLSSAAGISACSENTNTGTTGIKNVSAPAETRLDREHRPEPTRTVETSGAEKISGAAETGMDWDDPLDPIAITVEEVARGRKPVLLVTHDAGHGGWQFMDGADVQSREPFVIPKEELLRLDPSLKDVTDLPVGWNASRESTTGPWTRRRSPDDRD